ncbi:Histidine kinase osmosensor [Saxophila tyrrhenica]|uniref:Histidine kinase osmosensor n=1 Tax=Saxophila tyrrhenica TaxID=1690608 RepID=A0AAV9PBZ3_9PEZI|nr:Histidine kinase osmosensor [Saxophila tyrrhenica]
MRIAVRHQLSLLLIVSTSIGLVTLAVAVWISNHSFVLKVARDGLEAAASIKAVGIAISLDLMYSSCLYLKTSPPVQQALMRYNNGTDLSRDNWDEATADLVAALSSVGSLKYTFGVQSQLVSRWAAGPLGSRSVLNVTGLQNKVSVPSVLYPNLSISKGDGDASSASYLATYNGVTLDLASNLVLGPVAINENFSLMSMTLPVIENTSETNVLGWLTVTGRTLLFGPSNTTNHFSPGVVGSQQGESTDVRYLLPVKPSGTRTHAISTAGVPFPANAYPALVAAIGDGFHGKRELGSMLNTHDEDGNSVAVAYSTPPTDIMQSSHSERKIGFVHLLFRWRSGRSSPRRAESQHGHARRFRIPSKVDAPKHWVKDDISDLIDTFNDMADELYTQHSKLEGRVQQRTIELHQAKKAAESANESKTLFVANVSHELKTPLNGILGLCATSIEEDDVGAIHTTFQIIYKSGDLLLRTLNDLLTFSTNQIGSRELTLEEKEFSFCDLETQTFAIFEQQAKDRGIKLYVECESADSSAFGGTASLRDNTLWGDVHRILQVIINLISNSLKYTPNGGSVKFSMVRSKEAASRRLLLGADQTSIESQRSRISAIWRCEQGATSNFINAGEVPSCARSPWRPPATTCTSNSL